MSSFSSPSRPPDVDCANELPLSIIISVVPVMIVVMVMVVGHPYVDIWQCVRAKSLGIDHWPEVPMGTDWKTGVCDALGWGTPAEGWQRVLGAARSFADLDPALVTALERALDHFATEQ